MSEQTTTDKPLATTRGGQLWVYTAHRCDRCRIALACLWINSTPDERCCYDCLCMEAADGREGGQAAPLGAEAAGSAPR